MALCWNNCCRNEGIDMVTFATLYTRLRLKRATLRWFEAPYCGYDILPMADIWREIELAAIIFEEKHTGLLESIVSASLLKNDTVSRQMVHRLMDQNFGSLEPAYAIIACISLIGYYCRRLQAMDVWTNGGSKRDFRRDIDLFAFYGSYAVLYRYMKIRDDLLSLRKVAEEIIKKGWRMPTKKTHQQEHVLLYIFLKFLFTLFFALIVAYYGRSSS